MDSSNGILDQFMGNYESLRKGTCGNKISTALTLAILRQRKSLQEESTEEVERYEEYLTYDEELNPKSKPKKGKKDSKDAEADVDADADVDAEADTDLAYAYTYVGKTKVKDDDGNVTEFEQELKKKKFISMASPVKQIIQYILNCVVTECHGYYTKNNKTFPVSDGNILTEIKNYAQTECEDPLSPFVFEVSDLYGDVDSIVEDDSDKGTSNLSKFLETEFKKIFETGKSKKPISSQLDKINNSFIRFIKTLAVFLMDHFWENKTPLNAGKLFGTIRQLSRLAASKGGECPASFYEYARLYVKQNTTESKAKKDVDADGTADADADADATDEAPKKPAPKGKGKGRGKGAGKGAGKAAGKKTAAEPAKGSKSLDKAMDAAGGEDFGGEWADDSLPSE